MVFERRHVAEGVVVLPQPQCLAVERGGSRRVAAAFGLPCGGHGTPEAQQVEGVVRQAQQVAVADGGEHAVLAAWAVAGVEQAAQVFGVGVQDVDGA
nr:hypothetical protein [Nonomuraea wenchangensis]